MRIRKKYYACYNKSENVFVEHCLNWISKPLFYKMIIKYSRNLKIAIIRLFIKKQRSVYWQNQRTLPISLTINDLIASIANQYREETGINIYISNELKKTISNTEQYRLINEQKNILKKENEYLLAILNNLKSKNLCH